MRELRQNLSVYLTRVVAGETLEVTDRGRAVAVLAPLPRGESPLERLTREGRLIPATGDALIRRRPVRRTPASLTRAIQRERADRKL